MADGVATSRTPWRRSEGRAASVVLFRAQGTVNTGDAGGEMTAELRELAV